MSLAWSFPLFPEKASTQAEQVDMVFWALFVFSALIILTVFALVLYFSVRYWRGRVADRTGRVESLKPELAFGAGLVLISLGIFVWGGSVYFDMQKAPEDHLRIYVVGKQWMWKVRHPNGRREINELHVPAGRPVKLVLASQDVIHSFYVPAFRVKQDLLPDRYTNVWFEATKPGVYRLQCAEYCGTDHSVMQGQVVVMAPEAYQAWLEDQPLVEPPKEPGEPDAPMARGSGAFFDLGCRTCHLPDSAQRAPRLDGIFGMETRLANGETILVDEQYIRESVLYPNARIVAGYGSPSLMPTFHGLVTEGQLAELVEFIRSLRDGWPEGSTP